MRNESKKVNFTNSKPPESAIKETQDVVIYNQIFDAVLSQRLLPGTKLTEEELAKIFQVSRTIVRRALLRLSQDSIVNIKPNRGASIACPSVKQAREIISARRIIETAIVREVVGVITPEQIEELRQTVTKEKENVEMDARGSGIRLSGDFHLMLAKMSNNSTLTKFIRELIPQTSLIIARYEKPGFPNCSHEEHFELIDSIAVGNAETAVKLMDDHLQQIENKLDLTEYDQQVDLQEVFSSIA